MKQTSIEWLVDQLKKYDLSRDNVLIVIPLFIWKEKVEQAKAMEKKQMFEFTREKYWLGEHSLEFHKEIFEKWYNETFGGK